MSAIPWYKSPVYIGVVVNLLAGLVNFLNLQETIPIEFINDFVAMLFTAAGVIAAGIAEWKRRKSDIQPLTLTQSSANRQSGIIRGLMLAAMVSFMAPIVLTVSACSGVQAAYRAAESPDEYAFVLAEHYASLVKQAADLKGRPTTPREAVEKMQQAELMARPFVEKLRPLRDAYVAGSTAESEAELQAAINEAVTAIADLIRAVQSASGGTTTTQLDERILRHAELIEVKMS